MTPPVVPPTLSSTLLLGVLTAAFLLPAALPLDDETEVFLFKIQWKNSLTTLKLEITYR